MAIDQLIEKLNQTATLQRETFELFSGDIAGTQALTVSRSNPFYAAVILEDFSDGTGSITLTGTDENDDAASSTLTFTGNQRRWDTDQQFKTLTQYTSTGLTNEATTGTVSIEAVSSSGQPIEELTSLGTIKCRLSQTRLDEFVQATGGTEVNSAKMYIYPSADVRRNDRISLSGDGLDFEVKGVKKVFNHLGLRAFDQAVLVAIDDSG